MSWQSYVDDHLLCQLESGKSLKSAAIIDLEGSVWASSNDFPKLTDDEVNAIVGAFNDSSGIAQKGLFLGGTKYMVIQGEPGAVIRGKLGPGGVTIKKTNMAMLIGIYDESVTPGECNVVVEKLGDYLLEQGF